ncbi:peptide chain release factor N(5)-glutamine methyltransferase [bacterium]|nr:peptide chain release factor N(5)-glutamine methyltransferase [bacterium]
MSQNKITAYARSIEKKIATKYNDPILCNQYSWWILQAITNKKKEQLISGISQELTEKQLKKLDDWLDKLLNKNMPLQYILGTVPFLNLTLAVKAPTLIPRPETEQMCEELIESLSQLNNQKLSILDIGTGSGCIALSIAKALPYAQIYAVDIEPAALELAQENAKLNNIENVTFLQSDIFEKIPNDITFDLIISNPPYIAQSEWEDLEDSVTQWEDNTALVADHEGLEIIEKIIRQAPQFLKENNEMARNNIAQLLIEIGYKQGQNVFNLFKKFGFDIIKIKKDLEGKDRVVTGRINNVAISSKTK